MRTRVIGIDLAVTGTHQAVVLDVSDNETVTPVLPFHTHPAEMEQLVARAQADVAEEVRLVAVLEATGLAWFSVGQYLEQLGVEVYRVNGQQVKDLRRVYRRHAKADRIDVRVLARLWGLYPQRLHRLWLPSGHHMALQRACRELDQLRSISIAIQLRLQAYDHFAWPGIHQVIRANSEQARWWRHSWYNPWQVVEAGEEHLTSLWQAASSTQPADTSWIPSLIQLAQRTITLYQYPETIGYDHFQARARREQARLQSLQDAQEGLRKGTIRPLYCQIDPQRYLETLQGIGQDSAAVYIAFIGDISRFPCQRYFRAWSGLVPASSQSSDAQAQGLSITYAGPNLIKSTAFLNAGVARLYDPHIAAVYYTQMMERGKHHNQAICACATHLLNRIYTILKEKRPYQLRDLDGTPLSKAQARRICRERYRVPDEVRRRNNYRQRRARRERRIEQRFRKQGQ